MIKIFTAVAVALSLVVSSCSKDKDDDQPSDKSALLTQKVWAYHNFEEKFGNGPWTGTARDCDKDNRLTIRADKTFTFVDGAIECDPNNPINFAGPWNLVGTTLILGPLVYTIDMVNDTQLILSTSVTVNGVTNSSRTTYVHP